jgi:radical SAM superfamily enzyme YgiQ (UPF0313 family)
MKEKGTILLISCYELGRPPFGVALLSGLLAQSGFSVETCDLAIETLDKEKVLCADVVAISVPMHTALRIGVKAALRVRAIHPTATVVFFGLYASLNETFLLEEVADFVVGGEYEGALVGLMTALSSGADGDVAGVSRKGRRIAPNLKGSSLVNPVRNSLPSLSKYAQLEKDGTRFLAGYVEASRGCRHLCRHCPIPPVYEGRFTIVPKDLLLADIRTQVEMGAAHITFGDPDFLNGPNHSLRLVEQMHQMFPHLTFDFTAKIEHLLKYHDLIPTFAAAGCIFIISAVESLSDTVLHYLDKGHTQADVVRAIEIVHSNGMTLRPSLVPFTPWSTLADYIALFDFAEEHHLIDAIDPVQYTIRLLVPPGSLLLSQSFMTPYLGPLVQALFTYQWTHPDPQMDQLHPLVSCIVEEGEGDDPEIVFYQLKECAQAMQEGRPVRPVTHLPLKDRKKPPRLTESWFCCAEPTRHQITLCES